MQKGRQRKFEVRTDTQPQFELGDTTEDIDRREREREERDEREERAGREGQRDDGEREESRESGKGRVIHFPKWFRRRSHHGVH